MQTIDIVNSPKSIIMTTTISTFPRPFRFRLNCIDYYQTSPSSLDPVLPVPAPSTQIKSYADVTVPIIRIFGATETGQKVCAHIHGVFQYLYVEYNGSVEENEINAHIRVMTTSINHALSISFRRNPFQGLQNSYVAYMSVIKGVPFYGYHVGYRNFLKIYLRNPNHMTRLADLLTQGAILARVIQPYESHMQYIAQWMCDYNLYGCGLMDCEKVRFRGPVPSVQETINIEDPWNEATIASGWILDEQECPKESLSPIEIDIKVEDIMNRRQMDTRDIHHDFNERFFKAAQDYKFVPSMAGLWKEESIRRKKRMGLNSETNTPFPPEALVTMSADPRLGRGQWVHEEEFFKLLGELIDKESADVSAAKLNFDTFLGPERHNTSVQTALESVQELFPKSLSAQVGDDSILEDEMPYVDEDSILLFVEQDEQALSLSDDRAQEVQKSVPEMVEVQSKPKSVGSLMPLVLKAPTLSPSQSPKKRKFSELNAPGPSILEPLGGETSLSQRNNIPSGTQGSITSSFSLSKTASDDKRDKSSSKKVAFSSPAKSNDITLSFLQRNQQVSPGVSSFKLTATNTESSSRATTIASRLGDSTIFKAKKNQQNQFILGRMPPRPKDIIKTLNEHGRPSIIHQDAFYSNELDVPSLPQQFFGRQFKLQSLTLPYLPDFDKTGRSRASLGEKPSVVVDPKKLELEYLERQTECSYRAWQIATPPPSSKAVGQWVKEQKAHDENQTRREELGDARRVGRKPKMTQIEGPTMVPRSMNTQSKLRTTVSHETQYMSMMSVEVHVNTRNDLVPDPAEDPASCIFWSMKLDADNHDDSAFSNGIIVLTSDTVKEGAFGSWTGATVYYEEDELDMLNRFIDIVRDFDPDILVGYEVHNGSWGYLVERAKLNYELDLSAELSRVRTHSTTRSGQDKWGFEQTSAIKVTGRHMINVWRAVRGELNLLQYTLENVVFKVLHKRVPHYGFEQLTSWYLSNNPRHGTKVLNYFLSRVQLNLRVLDGIDIVARTSEQARLLGVDFFSVISRGSQFKVESLMFRIAKPENYILVSPSRKQVGQQNALECLPLVMEPQSGFYSSPLLVLDFQSLYPSIMIAYNYCYSTCLGRLTDWRGQNKMGFTDLERESGMLGLLKEHVNIAPNGMVYVRPEMRKSLLAKMLTEILETRVMVKTGMKQDPEDKVLQRLLNNRQLALKLIANVTYGYTSASFSGRMPCAEIADSIVQTARETLEKAIAFIHSVKRWDAEVVYGDTDSLFVYLKNRTKDEAFKIGKEIAETITKSNPRPVKLKFEKVYHPCVLLAKKRYVGWKYESPSQTVPEFDAKGIETVRRDGTPAEQKIEEKALKILFRTHDLSQVKDYFQEQCAKIMSGNVSIQDFLFAREVKLGTYSENGIPPAGVMIATKKMQRDPRREPQYGERVPYLVIAGAPGARLIDRCVDPDVLLKDDQIEIDSEYYISKNIIPPLERIFNLMGANVRAWYDEIPKVRRLRMINHTTSVGLKKTLETYMREGTCIVCRDRIPEGSLDKHRTQDDQDYIPICESCNKNPSASLLEIRAKLKKLEARLAKANAICRSCSSTAFVDEVSCDSRDCPVYYARVRHGNRLNTMTDKVRFLMEEAF